MLTLKYENNVGRWLIAFFFVTVIIEITSEVLLDHLLLFIFKPLISIGIMALYWNASTERTILFFVVLSLSLVTNLFFISKVENLLLIGLLVFLVHRLLIIYYVARLIKLTDYVPVLIAMTPFLFIFSYLLLITTEINTSSYVILIFQNLLISVIGGLTLSAYVMNYNKTNSWLFIFGLLSVMQYFIVFIEKYYLLNMAPIAFRPLAMLLNAGVYYTFYRFVIDVETKPVKGIVLNNN
ncbi:hypothetical protein [Flavobacterium sp. PL12]|uniref:hypothetical protein n=1 Tax=Flavobacterium sp. PL12 TaxID=3071718 RepID=UPI00319E98D2